MKHCMLLIAAALAAACSTTPVPGVCCIGSEDCNRLGLSEDRACPAGQACVDFRCVVPSCSTQGCPAEAPVCDVTTDVCTRCTDSSACSRFGGTDVCDPQTGSCVACLTQADCTAAAEPVCDSGSCRGCRLDAECPSGACGEDGACVPETAVVYLHPAGQNVAPCSRSAPCSDPQFGIRQTAMTRNHVVMAPGAYVAETIGISPTTTSATSLFIHGHGAKLIDSPAEVLLIISIPTTVRDLDIEHPSGLAILASQATLERIHVRAATGLQIEAGGSVATRDIAVEATGYEAIHNDGYLTLDRGLLIGGSFGVQGSGAVNLANLIVYGTSDTALQLSNAIGSVNFATVAGSGNASNIAGGIRCPVVTGLLTVRSSIFWTQGPYPAAAGECGFSSTIAGPVGAVGAMNADPLFVDAANRNYHLSSVSPARDMVNGGPALDFEGDPRPRGARFDIGADESP